MQVTCMCNGFAFVDVVRITFEEPFITFTECGLIFDELLILGIETQ